MSLQYLRSLVLKKKLLKSVVPISNIKFYSYGQGHHDNKPFKPINEPPNDHLTFKPAILDDLPEPHGDWLEDYNKRQRKYWVHFFMGLTILSSTLAFMWIKQPVFYNFFNVELPPKEERIKSFWIEPDDDDED
ncbi:hypothetical protein PGB90_001628 [Kerria lacca]